MNQDITSREASVRGRAIRSLLCGFALLSALACHQAPEKSVSTAGGNESDQLLRSMSEKLAHANKFTFKVDRKLDAALVEDRDIDIAEDAQIEISVTRPNKFSAKSQSKDYIREIFFDGQDLTVYDQIMNLYATVPAPGTIDGTIAAIDEEYGFTPPLAEFILSDFYGALSPHIKSKTYKGKETVAGVECHHLSLSGEVADSELWIGAADLLPYKLVATFKNREGNPKLQADFSNWNLSASLDEKSFAFVVPKDAEKVDMVIEDQMKETAAK